MAGLQSEFVAKSDARGCFQGTEVSNIEFVFPFPDHISIVLPTALSYTISKYGKEGKKKKHHI